MCQYEVTFVSNSLDVNIPGKSIQHLHCTPKVPLHLDISRYVFLNFTLILPLSVFHNVYSALCSR